MNRNLTDNSLISAIQQGNEHAFEILFKSYYSDLTLVAVAIVKDPPVAEELVSDVFYTIWKKKEQLRIHTSVAGYLKLATRNHALNYLKTCKTGWVELEDIAAGLPAEDQDPVQLLINEENWQFWQQKIEQLPPQRQKVFRMNKLEGLNYAEIAARLSLSEKTVRNQVQIALRSLRDLVVIFFALLLY